MREQSSNFVKVFFADKDKVLRQLRDYAEKLKQTEPQVQRIGYFGSYATDTFGPASDVDLLIILSKSDKRFLDRIPEYMPDNLSVACDVFAYTTEELDRMKREGDLWLTRILREVVWL
jgi:predicted nucleotidyltransferase